MSKILIVSGKLSAGGIERALLGMLNNLDRINNEITLLLLDKGGEFEKYIPNDVNVKYIINDKFSIRNLLKEQLINMQLYNATKTIYYYLKSNGTTNVYKSRKYMCKLLPIELEEYDLAVAYHTLVSIPVIYTINNTTAKRKVAWIHTDISRYGGIMPQFSEVYNKYDKIFSPSLEAIPKVEAVFPKQKGNVELFYNSIYKGNIQEKSDLGKGFEDDFKGMRIVTVARLSDEKGVEFMPRIVSRLIKEGYNIRWYWIGEGDLRNKVERLIKELNVDDKCFLLGNINNPYKFMEQSDIYVQPSTYECYCTTITEAKCLNKPIVVTEVNGTKEQIKHNQNGLITTTNIDSIYNGIKVLINNKFLREKFSYNLSEEIIDTRKEIKKLFNVL